MAINQQNAEAMRIRSLTSRQLASQAYGVADRMFRLLCANADHMFKEQGGKISGEQAGVLQCLARAWVMGQERVDFIKGRGKPAERPAELPKPKLRKLLAAREVSGKVIDICCGPAREPAKQLADQPASKSS